MRKMSSEQLLLKARVFPVARAGSEIASRLVLNEDWGLYGIGKHWLLQDRFDAFFSGDDGNEKRIALSLLVTSATALAGYGDHGATSYYANEERHRIGKLKLLRSRFDEYYGRYVSLSEQRNKRHDIGESLIERYVYLLRFTADLICESEAWPSIISQCGALTINFVLFVQAFLCWYLNQFELTRSFRSLSPKARRFLRDDLRTLIEVLTSKGFLPPIERDRMLHQLSKIRGD